MLFIFSTPVLIGHLRKLKTVVFLYRSHLRAVLLCKNFICTIKLLVDNHVSRVVEHSPHHPKLEGSSLAAGTVTKRDNSGRDTVMDAP